MSATVQSQGQMPIMDHLRELRKRILISVLAVVLGGIVTFIFADKYFDWVVTFYRDAIHDKKANFIFLGPLDAFMVRLKVATYGGIVLAMPVILWQLWKFVTPALHKKERKMAILFVSSSSLLFLFGGALGIITLKPSLEFLLTIGGDSLAPQLTADSIVFFVSMMVLMFGLSFEFPIVLVFLIMSGVLSTQKLRKWRRGSYVGIITFAAVITPSQDPYSLLLMTIPMWIFYEGAILTGRGLKR